MADQRVLRGSRRPIRGRQPGEAEREFAIDRRVGAEDRLEASAQRPPLPRRAYDQRHLSEGVLDDLGADWMAFGVVGVEEVFGCPAANSGGELPGEVGRVLEAKVEALPAER